jgi:uncharacterized protein
MTQADKAPNEPVTAVFNWTVQPDKEQEFEHLMHNVHRVARTFPGHMGVTTLKSPARPGSIQSVLRFDTARHLEGWLHSPARQKVLKPLEEIAHAETTKASGLETWFELPGQLVTPPPRWKMVLTTFIAIYPLSLLFGFFLNPHIDGLPVWLRALFLPIFAPIILTYILMPFLTQRVLKRWLYRNT